DVDADAGSAHQHAAAFSLGDAFTDGHRKVGVIDRLVRGSSQVHDFVSPAFHGFFQLRAQLDAGVIAADEHFHFGLANSRHALVPPKPNEFDSATSTRTSRALLGT